MSTNRINRDEILRLIEDARSEGRPKEVLKRLQWFLTFSENNSISKVCKQYNISRSTFYRWAQRFDRNDLSSLETQSKGFPQTLSDSNVSPITDVLADTSDREVPVGPSEKPEISLKAKPIHAVIVLSVAINIALSIFLGSGMATAGEKEVTPEPVVEVVEAEAEQETCSPQKTVYVPVPAEPEQPSKTLITEEQKLHLKNCKPGANGEMTCSISARP